MPVDDALNDGEPNARTFEVLGAVEPLENAEELVGVLHLEACSIVADEEDGFVGRRVQSTADLDLRGVTPSGVLDGVPDQVREDLFEQNGFAVTNRERPD